ncbi:lectin family integral membrane protein,putative [Blumeria hordei DH14]|uniref:Lectin family integral membrane protein,putative n=1 Tax=Blumeria graminis f. sp. hordei (strain DH14) TaxID=546991 RepID=N1JIQ6_BLUG1|nr:lectin family integral membrane protein,putative [Blumeria hordei DH14]
MHGAESAICEGIQARLAELFTRQQTIELANLSNLLFPEVVQVFAAPLIINSKTMNLTIILICLAVSAFAAVQEVTLTDANGIKSIPPYLDSDLQSRWFDFGGNTVIRADRYIRLTSDRPSQEGWIFSRVPLTATNWEVEIEFRISGAGNLHGDGFAMWLTKQRATPGPVFGSTDKFEGIGIFFDTYKNNRPGTIFPYVMAMIGDGVKSYDKSNDGKANEFMGCSAKGIRDALIPTKARLVYFQDKSLRLDLQYKVEGQWDLCFETLDPPAIPSVAYLGFSAETGELSDNHDLIAVSTKNLYDTKARDQTSGKLSGGMGEKTSSIPLEKKGWGGFLLKIMLFCIIIAGAYVGITAWRTNQRRSHRF